jgi:acyl-CoA synthetase (NDP forming)
MENNKKSTHFLDNFVNPRSIAFVGANESFPTNMGSMQILTLIQNGYRGKIYPIHPRLETVFGLKAYKSISDVPGPIDLAQLILPKKYVPNILTELGEHGVKNIILITAGYREINDEGSQDSIASLINKYQMHVIGPNCIGFINTRTRISIEPKVECITNTTVRGYTLPPGNVSIASQSGSYLAHAFIIIEERDLRFNIGFSLGNELCIDLCDCLEFFEQDPLTEVIMLYIEEIKRGRRFFELAKRISPKKPIIVLYSGGTEGGAKAISSHTGSLAGNDEIHNALFHQSGIIRTFTVEEFYDTGMIFSKLLPKGCIPNGNRMAIVTNSGGLGAMIADNVSRIGLEIPPFSEEINKEIQKYLPPTSKPMNPLDFTFSLNPKNFFYDIPKLLAESGEYDAMLTYGVIGSDFFQFSSKMLENIGEKLSLWEKTIEENVDKSQIIVEKYKFPIINVNFSGAKGSVFKYCNEAGLPTFHMPHRAVKALYNVIRYGKYIKNQ